ncbi:MAG TPA: hypothetical protein VD973_02370 [Symbiobacteriaceae bacterium]|nr:hypothetical protein [Symbiobacteriaceae bacterium]
MLVWQRFTETVLREDGARFAVETTGAGDAPLSVWVASAVQMLKHHHLVLACEWEEKTLPVTAGRPLVGWNPPWPAPGETLEVYAARRAHAFGHYAAALYAKAGAGQARRRETELPAFLEQLSLQRILDPLPFLDRRAPVAPASLKIALTVGGQYYVFPLTDAVPEDLPAPGGEAVSFDLTLTGAPRGQQAGLRRLLPPQTRAQLAELRKAPILINWDLHDGTLPLGELRRLARRGCNDHPLVLIRTTTGMIFDFSHVIFDAMWAIQVAELMTRLATSPALMPEVPPAPPAAHQAEPLRLGADPTLAGTARPGPPEVSAETTAIAPAPLIQLARRSGCTVGDILVLARWAYAAECGETPPALLVPVDLFPVDPRKRLGLAVIRPDQAPRGNLRALHEALQQVYAATRQGRTFAHRAQQVMVLTPPPFRAVGNWATEQVAWTNDRIKGREVFSNVGRVLPGSSAARFVSARGLGGAHDRVWGIMTTDRGALYVSMRDFRPAGQNQAMAQAYLDGFARFVNRMVNQLTETMPITRQN